MSNLVKVAYWNKKSKAHVIFVHGLGGDAYQTWQSDNKSDLFWPVWISEDNPYLTSWTFSYEAPAVNWLGTSMSLNDRAKNFLAQLLSEEELSNGNLVFVCHSLGGLVVKQMLREADAQSGHSTQAKNLVERTKAIMFIATPHTGSNIATLADKLRFLVWPSASTIDLMKNSPNLRNLNTWFRNWNNGIKCQIVYETRGVSIGAVVDPTSSDAGLPDVVPIPYDGDHIQIVKPNSRNDLVYKQTLSLVRKHALGSERKINSGADFTKPKLPVLSNSLSVFTFPKLLRISLLVLTIGIGGALINSLFQPFGIDAVDRWVEIAGQARKKGIIQHTRTIPTEVKESQLEFESWWNETPLSKKKEIEPKRLFDALSLNNRIYRVAEKQSETKPNANFWADAAIKHFEDAQDTFFLVESLLDKAAIYLEFSQIEHTEPDSFERIAKDGDAIMSRAFSLAAEKQKSSSMRIWSRFYYNLARPKGGRLHKDWSNDYLAVAYAKMTEAYDLEPDDPKNASQLARVAQKLAANPPQDKQVEWTIKLRDAQSKLLRSWNLQKDNLRTPEQRIPKINVLAVMTMDVVEREWRAIDPKTRASAEPLLNEIDKVALPAQQEVMATISQTEWEEDFDFDVHYDLGRIRSLQTQLLLSFDIEQANSVFEQALGNMKIAAEKASAIQAASAFSSVDTNPNMSGLPPEYRSRLKEIFEIK